MSPSVLEVFSIQQPCTAPNSEQTNAVNQSHITALNVQSDGGILMVHIALRSIGVIIHVPSYIVVNLLYSVELA